jgi:hypothetical protein
MTARPGSQINDAVEAGVVDVTRRIEVYQKDGVTPWYASSDDDPYTERLVDGSVTLDYNSDERRKGEVTLRNDDGAFRLNPIGGFYYDKVIKLYRGVRYQANKYKPVVASIEGYTGTDFIQLQRIFAEAGYTLVDKTSATTYSEISEYPIIAILHNNSYTKSALANQAYENGHHILTVAQASTSAQVPHIASTSSALGDAVSLTNVTTDHPLKLKIPATTGMILNGADGNRVTSVTNRGTVIAYNGFVPSSLTLTFGVNKVGTKWFNFQVNANPLVLQYTVPHLKAMLDYMATDNQDYVNWEASLGVFMVDQVNDQIRVPNQVKITFRDYTKKLLKDKLTFTSSFPAGTPLKAFVRAIAANGGITNFRESIGNELFPTEMAFERDTERWKIIKDACTAFDYEVYFDAEGYLVVRKFNDPTTSPIFHEFGTGPAGNLVEFSRSINDSRIYNIINVFGDPVEEGRLPYFGQAINDDPNSPTSTVNLGKRPFTYAFNYFSSDAECAALARSRLTVMGLESYDIDFSSIYYPWMEVGEVVQILDPYRNTTDPTRFLMDSVTLPLGLGPMNGTGKRITLVGNSG